MKRRILAVLVAVGALIVPATASAHTCREGDPPIQASVNTSCALAGNAVNYAYNRSAFYSPRTVSLYSPVKHRRYRVRLTPTWSDYRGWLLSGRGAHGIWFRFAYDVANY